MKRIFIYGTLKRGCHNHHYMDRQQFVATARTQPLYRLYDLGGYPGMVHAAGNGVSIDGELWDVDAACVQRLDILEGIDEGEYVMERVPLAAPYHDAEIDGYVYNRSVEGKPDAGNCWREA